MIMKLYNKLALFIQKIISLFSSMIKFFGFLNILETKKLNLVLDLDETLVKCVIPYSTEHYNNLKSEMYYLCDFKYDQHPYCIFYRPYLFECLSKWSKKYNIYIYTHSTRRYSDRVLEKFKLYVPSIKINKVWCRESSDENIDFKNLNNLGISHYNTIIVDDNIQIWNDFQGNVINVKQYLGPADLSNSYKNDDELLKIDKYLEIIYNKLLSSSSSKDMLTSYFSKPKSDLIDTITECNINYRKDPWIYDDYMIFEINSIYLDGEKISLPRPFLKPVKKDMW